MKKINFQKQILPHLVAVVIFLCVSVAFYHPLIFEGKALNQHDILQGKGAGSEMVEYRKTTGEEILWTNTMFSGMPTYLLSLRWSGDRFLRGIQASIGLYLPTNVRENFLAFVTFYILLLVYGVRPWLAIAGALAFGLNSFYVISLGAGHMWKVKAIALMALVLAGVHTYYTKNRLWGFIITAFALALQIQSNHLQVTYYLLIILIAYWISGFIFGVKNKNVLPFLGNTALLGIAAILAVSINIGRIWTTLEYGKYSIRGESELTSTTDQSSSGLDRDYAFRWSSGKWESLTMLIPNVYGGGSGIYDGKNSELSQSLRQNNVQAGQIGDYERAWLGYWGEQPGTAGPVYIGAIVCFLFVLAFFTLEKKHVYWMVGISCLAVILSWGKNLAWFNYWMFDHFPGYNKFRAVTMASSMATLCIPLMGFLGLEKFLQLDWNKNNQKKLLTALAITGGLTLLIALLANPPRLTGDQIPGWLTDAVHSDRKSIIRVDAIRSLVFISLAFSLIWLIKRAKISFSLFFFGMIVLVVMDLGMADWRYLGNLFIEKRESNFLSKTEADLSIEKDKDLHFRVMNLQSPYTESRTSLFHSSIGGYHGAKIRRYQDLIERNLETERQKIIEDQRITTENVRILSMLNTRYFLAGTSKESVIRNPYALGNSWFVQEVELVNTPDEEIDVLKTVNPATTAVIDQSKFGEITTGYDSSAYISLVDYHPDRLKYEANSQTKGLVVFSEIFYPEGWHATIDGSEVPILRANYVLRALEVPAGKHTIELAFTPDSYMIGDKITQVSVFIYLGLMIFGVVLFVKENK